MYEAHFQLNDHPFNPGSPSNMVYEGTELQEAVAHFEYAWENREAFFLLTGEVGTGKSTAIQSILGRLPAHIPVAVVSHTTLSPLELLEEIAHRFGLRATDPESKPSLIERLERFFAFQWLRGRRCVLIVDEAHLLEDAVLEELRLLSNLQRNGSPIVQICLIGQPELLIRLRAPVLRQLRQRIGVRYRLRPLSEEETGDYLAHRLQAAGSIRPTEIFTAGAVKALHGLTRGLPREINVMGGQAMLSAYLDGAEVVTRHHVQSIGEHYGYEGIILPPQGAGEEISEDSSTRLQGEPLAPENLAPAEPTASSSRAESASPERVSETDPVKAVEEPEASEALAGPLPNWLTTYSPDQRGRSLLASAYLWGSVVVLAGLAATFLLWKRSSAPSGWHKERGAPVAAVTHTADPSPAPPQGGHVPSEREPSSEPSSVTEEGEKPLADRARQDPPTERNTAAVIDEQDEMASPQKAVQDTSLSDRDDLLSEAPPPDPNRTSFASDRSASDAQGMSELGSALAENGRLDEAITAFRQAIKIKEDYSEAHFNLGVALKAKGDLSGAASAFRRAISIEPEDALAHRKLGIALRELGKLDEAVAAFRTAIALRPEDALAHHNLGIALRDSGRLDEAVAAFRAAVSLRPNDALAYQNLGFTLMTTDLYDEAIAAFGKAIELEPGYALAHYSQGFAFLQAGREDEAQRALLLAQRLGYRPVEK